MRRASVLALALLVTACTEFEPFDPPVAGELNPEPGLFTGPAGEFVISRQLWPQADDAAAAPAERKLTDPPPP